MRDLLVLLSICGTASSTMKLLALTQSKDFILPFSDGTCIIDAIESISARIIKEYYFDMIIWYCVNHRAKRKFEDLAREVLVI